MVAIPLDKDFLKKENPHERVVYKEVPDLVYSDREQPGTNGNSGLLF